MYFRLIFTLFLSSFCFSQREADTLNIKDVKLSRNDMFVSVGQNFTTYDYRNSSGNQNFSIKAGSGISIDIGKRFKGISLLGSELNFATWLSLNEYNSNGGNYENNYMWNTFYLGINTDVNVEVNFRFIKLYLSSGLGVNSIVYGKQKINGITYDIVNNNEMDGLFLKPFLELGPKLRGKHTDLGILFSISRDLSLDQNSIEKLDFHNIQIKLRLWLN